MAVASLSYVQPSKSNCQVRDPTRLAIAPKVPAEREAGNRVLCPIGLPNRAETFGRLHSHEQNEDRRLAMLTYAMTMPKVGLWCARRAVAFFVISTGYRDPSQHKVHFRLKSTLEEAIRSNRAGCAPVCRLPSIDWTPTSIGALAVAGIFGTASGDGRGKPQSTGL